MPRGGFEDEIEALFSEAPAFGDEEAFVRGVTERTDRLRRTGRLLHGLAATIGGGIALYQLAQPGLWSGLYNWLTRASAPLADPRVWTAPDLTAWATILGAGVMTVYVARLLRNA